MKIPKFILPVIVFAQFCCTSLWFAGNGIINDLVTHFHLQEHAIGHITSAVQLGFILGTLIFAILTISDRFSPSKVFFFSALFGAFFNMGVMLKSNTLITILLFRFLTGFFLAGIYPVGMKIAADYYQKGLGKSLGFLVGALVIGTAFPHLLKDLMTSIPWESVLISTSGLAILGGLSMLVFVPNGPFRKPSQHLDFSAFFKIFKHRPFRSAAFGYFGHMWELYTFWAFVPIMLKSYNSIHLQAAFNIPLVSFIIIAIGGPACVVGGYLAQHFGTKQIAFLALFLSGVCCLLFPLMFIFPYKQLFLLFLLFWSMVVIADSPLFSTLVAQNTATEIKGTALTITNSLGFAITIVSIQLINTLMGIYHSNMVYSLLAIGPILGLIALKKQRY